MARFNPGDRVRVQDVSFQVLQDEYTAREGQTGTVTPEPVVLDIYSVEFDDGEVLGFFGDELELVD